MDTKNPNDPNQQNDKVKKDSHQEYDGIIENNNPMPRWWLATLYLTILFAAVYYVMSQFMGKLRISDEYAESMAAHQLVAPPTNLVAHLAGGAGDAAAAAVLLLLNNPKALAEGQAVFATKCAMCHLKDGGGSIGPNLTDDHWLNCDGKTSSVYQVIANGVDGKGMPPWKATLSDVELNAVTAFVLSLRGTKPAVAKAPQGQEYH